MATLSRSRSRASARCAITWRAAWTPSRPLPRKADKPAKEALVPVSYSNPPGVAAPIGLYSQLARLSGGAQHLIFIAGQLSVDADGASVGEGDFPAQMRQVFANIGAVLGAEGLGFDSI